MPPAAAGHDTAQPANPNIFIFGKPGHGKGATAKQIALQRIATQEPHTRAVHDPAGEYTSLTLSLGATLIDFTNPGLGTRLVGPFRLARKHTAPQVLATHTLADLALARPARSGDGDVAKICGARRAWRSPQAVRGAGPASLADAAVAAPARSTRVTRAAGEW
ncbi:hypothetical protein PD653_3031 [Nocardioides sp. PD653]|nr:hypothetical protein PD653B2_4913 [Nocardioides sp. PD653-B2]GAW55606.1 hypothetical protein PD653_3031 [Nocardioides sp. PD653]